MAVGLVGLSLFAFYGPDRTEEVTETITEERTREKTLTKTVIKEERRADGTETREITIVSDAVKVSERKDETVKESKGPSLEALEKNDYRLGVKYDFSNIGDCVRGDCTVPSIEAGRRLIGDFWVDGQANLKTREVSLGVSYEF